MQSAALLTGQQHLGTPWQHSRAGANEHATLIIFLVCVYELESLACHLRAVYSNMPSVDPSQ